MSIEYIINRLEKSGHTVTKSMSTGNVVVTNSWGGTNVFSSYTAAYKFYYAR